MHRSLQWCGHALYKISKRFDHWVKSNGLMKFHEILVWDAFLISYIATVPRVLILSLYTVRCHYIAVNVLQNTHKRHPIARLGGRGMGCLSWLLTLMYVLLQSVLCWLPNHMMLDRFITVPDRTIYSKQGYQCPARVCIKDFLRGKLFCCRILVLRRK